jgi:hypothetical protein
MTEAIGALIGMLIGATIFSLIGAIMLRAGAQWVIKQDVHFRKAYTTMLLASIVNVSLGYFLGLLIGSATQSADAVNAASLLIYPVGFFIQSGFISYRLRTAFGSACLISLAMIAIGVVITVAVGGIILGIMMIAS